MTESNICAIVVTHHPDQDVLDNLKAVRPQVQTLVVVDNGSSVTCLDMLRKARTSIGFTLVENGTNKGIAAALNIGIRNTSEPWILLFDQDSRVTEDFQRITLRCFQTSRWADRLGMLVPRYQDKRLGGVIPPERLGAGTLAVAMTSGSLYRRETFQVHGLFAEELFIDGVDHEYSLRLRAANLVIDECPDAVLLHSPGTPTCYQWFGWSFQATNYSPIRRFYQERNKIWIYKRYLFKFPGYCLRQMLASAKSFVKIVLLEREKLSKIRLFLRGILDGLMGRTGSFNPPSQ